MSSKEFVHDSTNERAVIVAALALLRGLRQPGDDGAEQDSRRRAAGLVRSVSPDEFLYPLHCAGWRALRLLVDRAIRFDAVVLARLVAEEGHGDAESAAYLDGVVADSLDDSFVGGVVANLDYHVGELHWDALRAGALRGVVPELIALLKDAKAGQERVLGAARALVRTMEGGGGRRYVRRAEELKHSFDAELSARAQQGNFYPFGYPAVDSRLSEGAMPKRTAVLAGVSAAGKSAFVCDWAYRLACEQGRRVLYCAWEMGAESTLEVMLAQRTRIPLTRIIQGSLAPEELLRVRRVKDELLERITFMENPFHSTEARKARAKSRVPNDVHLDILEGYLAESGCDVVVYDLWDRLIADGRPDAVTGALARQVELHKEYSVYGVLVSQLNLKDVEARADQRPTRKDIKGVGSFVEMSDQVFAVHREAASKDVPDDTIELLCLKQKKGAAFWSTRFVWEPELMLPSQGVPVPYWPDSQRGESFDVDKVKTRRGYRGREG